MEINNSMFSEALQNNFLKDGFYAKPINTKIYLSLSNEQTIIGNAVAMNLEENNEKIPVYSYNSDIYAKYLNGKKIITGFIAMRKITLSSFLYLIKSQITTSEIDLQINNINESINELMKSDNSSIYSELISELENEKNNLLSKSKNQLTEDIYSNISELSEELKNDNLLYYTDNYKKNIEIKIIFEGDFNNPTLTIYDVLLVKKQTEISIDKNDIIEVYQFIGNPGKNNY